MRISLVALTYDKALRLTQRRIDNAVAGTGSRLLEDYAHNPASQLDLSPLALSFKTRVFS